MGASGQQDNSPHPQIEDKGFQYKLNVLTNNGGMLSVGELRAKLTGGLGTANSNGRQINMPDRLAPEHQKNFKSLRYTKFKTQTDDCL